VVGIDTNVLVRYLAQDDPRQSSLATRFIETELSASNPGFISLVVLVEMCWVLKRLYAADQDELVATVRDLLSLARFHVERRDVVAMAVDQAQAAKGARAELVDALIAQLATSAGCTHTVSFDKAAVRSAGMRLLA